MQLQAVHRVVIGVRFEFYFAEKFQRHEYMPELLSFCVKNSILPIPYKFHYCHKFLISMQFSRVLLFTCYQFPETRTNRNIVSCRCKIQLASFPVHSLITHHFLLLGHIFQNDNSPGIGFDKFKKIIKKLLVFISCFKRIQEFSPL